MLRSGRRESAQGPAAAHAELTWAQANNRDTHDLKRFLLPLEWAYVPLTARLRERERDLVPRREGTLMVRRDGAAVTDALMITRHGLVLPALATSCRQPTSSLDLSMGRANVRAPRTLYSAMGPVKDVGCMELMFGIRPAVQIRYLLMVLDQEAFRPPARPQGQIDIRRCVAGHGDHLFELQKAYEIEEVLLDQTRFSSDACRLLLRRSLRNELVYVAEIDGRPVAKAATNAQGYHLDQLGGVFTDPGWRRRGFAAAVVGRLLEEVLKEKRGATLFVKTHNMAAIRLYEALGFVTRGDYAISYYQH